MITQLSRSRFASGLQCQKLQWWMTHEPDAPELVPDSAAWLDMEQGIRVCDAARARFPGGILLDATQDGVSDRLRATERTLARGEPAIFEATFSKDGVVVGVDILAWEGGSTTLIEVSSSTSVNEYDLMDAALKAYVLRRDGVDVDSVEIMHLNDSCRFPDLDDLFVRESISGRVRALFPEIDALIADQAIMVTGSLPEIEVGRHCDEPHTCPFKSRCWPDLPRHHVETFVGLRRDISARLEAQGLQSMDEVPLSFPLTLIQKRQQRSVTEEELQVEGDLVGDLAPMKGRVAFLDFETVRPAIPIWEGLKPWDPVPVHFSCHIASPGEDLRHVDWLAEGLDDSRPVLAEALVETLQDVDSVVTYDRASGKRCFELIASGATDHAPALNTIRSKLRDLHSVVRNHVYHRDFLGSFELEAVLPALVPDAREVSSPAFRGRPPSAILHRLLFSGDPREAAERDAIRQALLDHHARDSLALLRLKERLDDLAEAGATG